MSNLGINKEIKNEFTLRHSKLAMFAHLIFAAFMVYLDVAFVGGGTVSIAIIIGFISLFIFLSYWHTAYYKAGALYVRLFPHKTVSMNISDITDVKYIFGDMFRYETRTHIAVYDKNGKAVKISTTFFIEGDIRKLLQIIRELRPDLTLPEKWSGTKW